MHTRKHLLGTMGLLFLLLLLMGIVGGAQAQTTPQAYSSANIIDRPVIGTRCALSGPGSQGAGSYITKYKITLLHTITGGLVVGYGNTSSAFSVDGVWVQKSDASTPIQLPFSGGNSTSLGANSVVKTVPYALALTQGDYVYIYTAYTVTSSLVGSLATEPSLGESLVTGTPPLTPASVTGTANAYAKGPTFVMGNTATNLEPTYGFVGTSISYGNNDILDGYGGFVSRCLDTQHIGHLHLSIPGAQFTTFTTSQSLFVNLLSGCQIAVSEYGANNISGATPSGALTAFQSGLVPVLTAIHSVCPHVYQVTTFPRTDGGTTASAQYAANRPSINAWIRAGCGGNAVPIDLTEAIEQGTDSNNWQPGASGTAYTYGGPNEVHPSAAGHQQIANLLTSYMAGGIFTYPAPTTVIRRRIN